MSGVYFDANGEEIGYDTGFDPYCEYCDRLLAGSSEERKLHQQGRCWTAVWKSLIRKMKPAVSCRKKK